MSRYLCSLFVAGFLCCQLLPDAGVPSLIAAEPAAVEIGQRRELFVDHHLIEDVTGEAKLEVQQAEPHEVVLVTDEPWEGNTCAYYTIFQDGDLYRMYYRGSHSGNVGPKPHPEFACYAESKDGIHWTKPELGLFEFAGSKQNNIVWQGVGTHNFTPFIDTNPRCKEAEKYKAIGRGGKGYPRGLYAFASPDGIHWSLLRDTPIITQGNFDSQNLAFWDPVSKLYRDYHRKTRGGKRDIMLATSQDFLQWTDPKFLEYPGADPEHLYTNAIRRYDRAMHLLIGFPTRYLPQEGSRVEPIFMASRDGITFHRWSQPVIPESAPEDRGGNRSNYMTWGLVEINGEPKQYSVYATEAYYEGPDSRVRRFTLRKDGFVALTGAKQGGKLTTKPIKFDGNALMLNFATRGKGSVRVELQDASGQPLPGFSLDDCEPLTGDTLAGKVKWKGDGQLGELSGKAVRMVFQVKDADLFAYQFQQD